MSNAKTCQVLRFERFASKRKMGKNALLLYIFFPSLCVGGERQCTFLAIPSKIIGSLLKVKGALTIVSLGLISYVVQ